MDAYELGDRIKLAHANLQAVADSSGIDILHVKGYAALDGFYPTSRFSTDADILVRPSQVEDLIGHLVRLNWERVTGFTSGSAFQHAATYRHSWWGAVDIHRNFPGIQCAPEDGFDLLWSGRQTAPIAHFPCTVPAYLDQLLIILLHAGRDGYRGTQDAAYIRSILSDADMEDIRRRAGQLRGEVALAASLGELEEYRNHPDYLLWRFMSQGGSRLDEWVARWSAARTTRDKIAVATSALMVNQDHLAIRLGHKPSRLDIASEWMARNRQAGSEAVQRLVKMWGQRSRDEDNGQNRC
ncbi:nucleotidyltransferase family protein [Rothia uropygialis]|uniref:nucleotidyltransferase family protein n=1 Tax=Kocuria sp. 36 TaxID=1415402 RepID=UPI0013EC17DD|nr:nucleotidyltransferase family protein [Kocuria sp. 36]